MSTTTAGLLLDAGGVWKSFDRTVALSGVDFNLVGGEVHALVGANGAGKSTFSRIVSGHMFPDRGRIEVAGSAVSFASPRDAIAAGIAIVMQETSLAPDLSILENICLPELGRPGRLSWSGLRRKAEGILHSLEQGHELPLDRPVRDLTIGQRQLIEIAKALALDSRIIIFDEPTASFSPREVDRLFEVIRRLAEQAKGIIFVSHRLEEVLSVSDRITVFREGRTVVNAASTVGMKAAELVRAMVGREIDDIYSRRGFSGHNNGARGKVLLTVEHLASRPNVRDLSFRLNRGEILGIAGLIGAGRSEAAEALFGLRRIDGGSIHLEGQPYLPLTPFDAIRAGVGLIPEDRRSKGLIPDFSVKENVLLANLGRRRGFGTGYGEVMGEVARILQKLDLPIDSVLNMNILQLSGGMQQKVILARWLLLQPKVLILDEPTRGVDIGTRSAIYGLLRELAAADVGVIIISSDFEEVLGIADRVVVVSDGGDVADIPSAYLDVEKLAMFAAPRSSAEATHRTLEALARHHGGTAFWIYQDRGRVYCFDHCSDSARGVDPGFSGGGFPIVEETHIATALERQTGEFTTSGNGLATLLVPVHTRRGHDLGLIGLSLNAGTSLPDPAQIRQLVQEISERSESHMI